jgi:Cysteine-rich secretory protein family
MMRTARIAAISLGAFTVCCASLPAHNRPPGPDGDERALFDAANRERALRHITPLHWDERLARAARDHALLMAQMGAISHQFPGEPALSSRISGAGLRFSFAAENVAIAQSPAEIQDAWMHSPGHRENLLDKRAEAVGIAALRRGVHLYAVEDFAHLAAPLSYDQQEREVGALLAARGLRLLSTTGGVRQTCALSRGVAPGIRPRYLVRYVTVEIDELPGELLDELARGSYQSAAVGACAAAAQDGFAGYRLAVLLY